jgi:hypothetical protein
MRVCTSLALCLALSAILAPALGADDFAFVAGTYAMDAEDCKAAASGKAFSDELVETLTDDVMTPAGITSAQSVHCRFRSAAKSDSGWTVKADGEDSGETTPAELKVTSNPGGALAIANEDIYGTEPQVFQLCPK